MRMPIVAGNWKMFKTPSEAVEFANALLPKIRDYNKVERVVCPPFIDIPGVHAALATSPIKVGAQNVHWEKQGAFTGSIAASMLQGLVEYVIIGHSEVRQYQGDTDEMVNKKVKAALAHGLKPIVAVGESLKQRQEGDPIAFVSAQVRAAFSEIPADALPSIVVAYEPIWAIGTGLSATAEQAQETIKGAVRDVLVHLYGNDIAQKVRIQYGGSVNPGNIRAILQQADIDGALVGGACLKVDDFTALIQAAQEVKG